MITPFPLAHGLWGERILLQRKYVTSISEFVNTMLHSPGLAELIPFAIARPAWLAQLAFARVRAHKRWRAV
jgi:hypothetical protein